MMRPNVGTALICLCLMALLAGCLGAAQDDGTEDRNRSMDGNVTEPDERIDENATETAPNYTSSGFPRVRGVEDGASLDIGERVLWLNQTNQPSHTTQDAVVINLTVEDPGSLPEPRRRAFGVVTVVLHGNLDDRRIEPTPNSSEDGYATMRRYLADALLRATPDGPVRQNVTLLIRGEPYRVTVGDRWTGGPTLDPSDPPTNLTVRRDDFGDDVTVTLWQNQTRLLSETMDLPRGTDIYTFDEPGDYRVRLEMPNGTTYEAPFTVSFEEMADCNATWIILHRDEEGTLTATLSSTLAGCGDPADIP